MNRRHFLRASGGAALAAAAGQMPAANAAVVGPPPGLPVGDPTALGFVPARLALASDAVAEAVRQSSVPGAVLLIARRGKVAVQGTYGFVQVKLGKRPVLPDTVFDLASLTKVVATATAIAHLYDAGKVELDAPVARYLPAFAAAPDKAAITLRHLLTHTSGLVAGAAYSGRTLTLDEMVGEIAATRLRAPVGTRFIYSDFSAVLLGAVVRAVSGQALDVYCRAHLWEPLGMRDTAFNPPPTLALRCAATTSGDDTPETRGRVHDPIARALGGVSGNAGLFSTAPDLARFCQMLLQGGQYNGVRVLNSETVTLFTSRAQGPLGEVSGRGLGWDLESPYSVRGTLPVGSFGHTGFTGTSLWVDPATQTFIVLLTNAVHALPSEPAQKAVIALRRVVSTRVAESFSDYAVPAAPVATVPGQTRSGLDALAASGYARLKGRKIGVVCNHTALDRQGRHIVDLMHGIGTLNLVALYGPEHGIRGAVDASEGNSRDAQTGLPVYSLYNLALPKEQRYRPSNEQLQGVDTLVFDIQDIGARYYTYIATLGYCLEASAKHGLKIIVLDRPNPLGGNLVEGPLLDAARAGNFTAYHTMPISHGCTTGELARLFNAEKKLGADLEVVPLENWTRGQYFDQTGLPWVNPSPNMRSVRAAFLYPGVGFLEVLPVSVGRGTDTPFEIVGAPWVDPQALYASLSARNLPGVTFVPTRFTPTASVHKGAMCGGVQINLWDRAACRPSELGIHLADALARLYPDKLTAKGLGGMTGMIGSEAVVAALIRGDAPAQIIAGWAGDVQTWKRRRLPFLLYSG